MRWGLSTLSLGQHLGNSLISTRAGVGWEGLTADTFTNEIKCLAFKVEPSRKKLSTKYLEKTTTLSHKAFVSSAWHHAS
jgi:hypothetical protein